MSASPSKLLLLTATPHKGDPQVHEHRQLREHTQWFLYSFES